MRAWWSVSPSNHRVRDYLVTLAGICVPPLMLLHASCPLGASRRGIAQQCWSRTANERPKVNVVLQFLKNLKESGMHALELSRVGEP